MKRHLLRFQICNHLFRSINRYLITYRAHWVNGAGSKLFQELGTSLLIGEDTPRNTQIGRCRLGAHQTQELLFVNLANIEETFGYADDPVPMLQQQLTGTNMTGCELRLDLVRCEALVMLADKRS